MAKPEMIPLTEQELTELINASNGRCVHATFPGGKLIVGSDTRWCLPIIADMRGVAMTDELRAKFNR